MSQMTQDQLQAAWKQAGSPGGDPMAWAQQQGHNVVPDAQTSRVDNPYAGTNQVGGVTGPTTQPPPVDVGQNPIEDSLGAQHGGAGGQDGRPTLPGEPPPPGGPQLPGGEPPPPPRLATDNFGAQPPSNSKFSDLVATQGANAAAGGDARTANQAATTGLQTDVTPAATTDTRTGAGVTTGLQGGQGSTLTPLAPPYLPPTDVPNPDVPTVPGGNTAQNQGSTQVGTYSNIGDTTNTQTGKSGGTDTTNMAGTTTSAGGQQTHASDDYGFGALLKSGQAGATANDATRNAYLSDLVSTGGANYAGQTDAAIRGSLTGPQATGAGDGARARIAGDAAANIQRNNTGERLQAAQQLAGPTATTTLSSAANPYIGQIGSTSNNATTAQSTGSVKNDFSNLVNDTSEAQAGSAVGIGKQAANGLALQNQQSSGGGGCVLCTAAIDLGLPGSNLHRVLRTVISYKLHKDWKNFRHAARGYFFLFTPLARYLLRHPCLAQTLWPIAKACVYEELRVAGRPLPKRVWASVVHWTGHGVCSVVGRFPVPGVVRDKVITEIARREGILFTTLP